VEAQRFFLPAQYSALARISQRVTDMKVKRPRHSICFALSDAAKVADDESQAFGAKSCVSVQAETEP
jgi:hypothetical protein